MDEEQLKKLINDTVTQAVIKLKKVGLIKETSKSAFKKTEELLRKYNTFKEAIKLNGDNTGKAKKQIKIIDNALKSLEDDYYIDIVKYIFFENKTREEIAEIYNVEPRTITRNKNRLVNKLKIILFSDAAIEEIYS